MDAGIMEYIMKKYNMSMADMMTTLNKKSGVLGISGVSSDFRDLDNAAAEGNERAALAVEVFEYGVRKMIAEYAAAMGGVDAVIFTAGVGENSADMRLNFVKGLEFMGIEIDPEKNNFRGEERIVSPDGAKVKVLVIPTNEELMIAKDTAELVG
jgi:acetate kinase